MLDAAESTPAVETSEAPVTETPAPVEGTDEASQGEKLKDEKPKQEKPSKRYLKVKVNGKEVEVDEDTLIRDYSKYTSADEKFREAAKLTKSTEAFLKALKENPEAVLSDPRLALKKKEIAEKWLREAIEAELETPEAKASRERDEELKRYKAKEQEEITRKEQEEYQKVVNQKREEIAKVLGQAMELSPLSKDPDTQAETLREMAVYLRACKAQGYDATPEDIAAHVLKQKINTLSKLAESLDVGDLVTAFGDSFINKIRRHDLEHLQKRRQKPAPETVDKWEPSNYPPKREFIDPYTARIKK